MQEFRLASLRECVRQVGILPFAEAIRTRLEVVDSLYESEACISRKRDGRVGSKSFGCFDIRAATGVTRCAEYATDYCDGAAAGGTGPTVGIFLMVCGC